MAQEVYFKTKNEDQDMYGDKKIHQMVVKRYKQLRNQGSLQSLQDIHSKLPPPRIEKQNYTVLFQVSRQNIEEKINHQTKIEKILKNEKNNLAKMQVKNFKDIKEFNFGNQDQLYTQKLKSGLPIFKSILYMRYQDNNYYQQIFGQEYSFLVDEHSIEFGKIKHEIGKIKLFLEDNQQIPKINLCFDNQNTLELKNFKFPTMRQIQKRADVLAKIMLLQIHTEQHRKLKQIWKNDERYIDLQKNQKKVKPEMQSQKIKQGDNPVDEQLLMKIQVERVMRFIEQKANMIAHQQFLKRNGEKAVQTKKSLQKLKNYIKYQLNPKNQLKMLIAYKQKKSWA